MRLTLQSHLGVLITALLMTFLTTCWNYEYWNSFKKAEG